MGGGGSDPRNSSPSLWIRQCCYVPVLLLTIIGLEQDIPNPRNSPLTMEAFMCCVYFGQMPDDQPLNTYTPPLPSSSYGAPTTISTNRSKSSKYIWSCSLFHFIIRYLCTYNASYSIFKTNSRIKKITHVV